MAVRKLPPDTRTPVARRRRRGHALAIVLAIAGALCVAFGARAGPEPAAASARSPDALATPLWSPRRVPELFVAAAAGSKLDHDLSSIVTPFASCVGVDDPDGPLTRIHTNTPLAGASTQKLLIAAGALANLGPTFKFKTEAVSGARLQGGVLDGDLVVVGAGDPVLTSSATPGPVSTRLSDLADAIARAGVTTITGALLGDDTRFDRQRFIAAWTPSEIAEGDAGALGALVVDGGRGDDGRPLSDPALTTVEKLETLLSARGVRVEGGTRDEGRPAPADARAIASVESPPLRDIVEEMLTSSNNETAELLTIRLGIGASTPATTARGAAAIVGSLSRLGARVAGLDLHDGSGLAPTNRVTCDALLRVVELASQPRYAAILRGLPTAGKSGTLAGRLLGTALTGRLRAKTGHIDGVVGLAGVIVDGGAAPNGVQARFAFLANGDFSTETGEHLQDRIATAIGAYVDTPPAPGLVPMPR